MSENNLVLAVTVLIVAVLISWTYAGHLGGIRVSKSRDICISEGGAWDNARRTCLWSKEPALAAQGD